jgi:hypothetical protein
MGGSIMPITVRLFARRAALLRLLVLACLAAAVGRAFAADKRSASR